MIGGDFNEILSNDEKEGGVPRTNQLIEMFRLALLECSLSDLGFVERKFTWSNNRSTTNTIRYRLNRVCDSSNCITPYPDSYVNHLRYPGSNHALILYYVHRLQTQLGETRRRPWRFEAQWI